MSKQLSTKEVSTHKSVEEGLWIIIDNEVYDVTKFIEEHPGGPKILKRVGGKDASKQFWKASNPIPLQPSHQKHPLSHPLPSSVLIGARVLTLSASQYHSDNVLKKYKPKLMIGSVKEDAKL